MKQHIANHSTYSIGCGNPAFETFSLPSMTIPGQTLSLKQLLERYVRGETITTFSPTFSGDDDLPDGIEKLDPMDRIDMARNIKAAIKHHQNAPTPVVPGIPLDELKTAPLDA